jgi:tRNA-dihydrouridine synthase
MQNEKKSLLVDGNFSEMKPYEFWEYLGNPRYVCAPMVDQSELAFRLLTKRYGVDLAFTPMVHSV